MKIKQFIPILLTSICALFISATLFAHSTNSSLCTNNKNLFHQNFEAEFATSVMESKGFLLFFMNPNGQPCQIQGKILEANRAEIEKQYLIKYISSTDSSNHSLFYRFGVRSMPLIILLNKNGTIKYRFSPGIHTDQQILSAIQSKN